MKTITGSPNPQFPVYDVMSHQGPNLATPEMSERIGRFIDANIPNAESPYNLIAQYTTGKPHPNSESRALPWPDDLAGFTIFIFHADDPVVKEQVQAINAEGLALATEVFGGNHQMWWGASDPPTFPEDRPLFFETEEKYNRLVDIKACVDPDALFDSGLFTLPLPTETPKSCKKAKGMKGKAMMGKKSKKSMKHMKMGKKVKKSMKHMKMGKKAKKSMKGMMGY